MYVSKFNIILDPCQDDKKVLINPLSGAIDIIDESVVNIFQQIDMHDGKNISTNDLVSNLFKRGYIFSNANEEEYLLQHLYQKWKEKIIEKPKDFYIFPTYRCNLKCPYCFQNKELRRKGIIHPDILNKMFKAIEFICKEDNCKSQPTITIFGGEPLIFKKHQFEVIKQIMERCKKQQYKIRIITNGVDLYYFTELLSKFELEFIQITVDGPKEIHDKRRVFASGKGSFEQIMKGVDESIKKNIKLILRINLDEHNINSLPQLADFIIRKEWINTGKFDAYASPVRDIACQEYNHRIPEHHMLKNVFRLYEEYDQMKVISLHGWIGIDSLHHLLKYKRFEFPHFQFCGANIGRLCLDLKGDMYSCLDITGEKKYSIGSFYPILDINFNYLYKWRKRDIFTLQKCRKCKWSLFCGGGCTLLAISKEKSLAKSYCPEVKENLIVGMKYYYPMLKKMSIEKRPNLKIDKKDEYGIMISKG